MKNKKQTFYVQVHAGFKTVSAKFLNLSWNLNS